MKYAIAVGIGGFVLTVVWFSLGLSEKRWNSAECPDREGCTGEVQQTRKQLAPEGEESSLELVVPATLSVRDIIPSTAVEPLLTKGETFAGTPAEIAMLSNGLSAAKVYTKTCAACHDAGLAEAPKFGDNSEWAVRAAKGLETLYRSSVEGVPPAMPARGMCFDCSDDDLKVLVDYMLNNSM